jgi:hypothetical protein
VSEMAAPLGSWARPRKLSKQQERCLVCRADSLWSNFFTPEGDGTTSGVGAKWLTLCQSCGEFYA